MRYVLLLITLLLSACSTGVIVLDSDTYLIERKSVQLGFVQRQSIKDNLYREANAFCAKSDKHVEPIKVEQIGSEYARMSHVALKFRCRPARDVMAATAPARAQHAADVTPGRERVSESDSDIDTPPIRATRNRTEDYAIVIGVENYRQQLPAADFAANDARSVSGYLIQTLGYPEDNVVTLLNERAGNVDLAKYLERWLPNHVGANSSVFIYFSGHGAPNPTTGDAYLVPYDGDPAFIDETGYSLQRMYATLGSLPAKQVVVALDACFSGAGGRSVVARGVRSISLRTSEPLRLPTNLTVLSASSGAQTSSTYAEKRHGLFTYFLLKGIRNEDVFARDGSLLLQDLFAYVEPQVESIARRKYNNEQTPQLTGTGQAH